MSNTPPRRRPATIADALRREDLPPVKYYLSTGSTLLDLGVSDRCPGGVGSGRVTQFYGGESTAKTLLTQEILGSAQRLGGSDQFEDAEHTLDFGRATRLFGMDVGPWADEATQIKYLDEPMEKAAKVYPKFIYRCPATIEGLWDDEIGPAIELLKAGELAAPAAMGVDSFSALPSLAELVGKDKTGKARKARLTDATMGTSRAKQYSAAFRKYINGMARYHLTVIAVDQTRTAVGASKFEPQETTSGGKAIAFYASTRILLHHAGNIKNKHGVVQGVKIRFKVTKNKIAPPFRQGIIRVLFDYGIDDVTANLEWLLDDAKEIPTELKLAGSTYSLNGQKLGVGMDAAVLGVENLGLEKELQAEVVKAWRVMHQSPERKPKERNA